MNKKIIEKEILSKVIKKRKEESNKTNYGRILLICGSQSFGGAAIMASKAVVYSGAGLVTLASDMINRAPFLSSVSGSMFLDYTRTDKLINSIAKSDVILIGSGLEDSDFSFSLLKLVFQNAKTNQLLVLDGTALSMIGKRNLNIPKKPTIIMTPHQGEWQRVSGLSISEQVPVENYKKMVDLNIDFLVLKSSATEIYALQNPREYKELNIGGPFQAIGGMGDTLAGLIAGFLGQFKNDQISVIQAATYLHSYIARNLSQKQYVTLPTRISEQIPTEMKKIIQTSKY
ncbi:sugar kinase [Oenococcus oeni]|uniref:ATP-dependent (S)-NAD(P)H-hydrate dehydratase n=1 Tax=Oenococcus oeni TaxID=1247 RepID=UPI0008F7FB9F|nr:ADP/ATP-dependent (S)-NAD(P)H-hydrate dehydratase [Oenococcus oeni]OIM87909.1 sugar kinase [Oenococcus oeni]